MFKFVSQQSEQCVFRAWLRLRTFFNLEEENNMKKSVQKITAVMLTLLLLASIIPLNSMIYVEAATTDGGKVNDTISWNYNDGALTISGSGEMPNYKTTNSYYDGITTDAPWGAYLNVIRTVIVSGSVSNIGDSCFSDCPSLSSVTLCSSIERIGTSAFARCVSLSRITLPESLAEINGNAFIGCTKLDEVLIPDSVTFIGSSAFQLCSSLSQIKLSANLKEICSYSFYLCKSLTSIEIPNSVSEIGGDAFRECNRIQKIVIPQSVSYIGSTAFFNCSSLKKATIYNNSVGFGKNVFSGCNSDFKLYGYLNSTSQTYAGENGHSFVALDDDGTEITPTNTEVIDKQDSQNIITAVKSIRTKMKNRESTVEGTVNLFATSPDTAMKEMEKQIFAYTSDAQEGDYLRDNCLSYSYSYSTSTVSGYRVLKYKYIFEYKTTYEQEQAVSINVSQIISRLSLSGLSDYEKAEKIYDYIVKNVSYDYQHYLDSSYIPQFTAYAALVDKKAVCEGYSLLFYRMAVEAGITCRIVSGKVGNSDHAWNLLKLDDLYYCVDTTFASSGNDSDSYFLKGSITFKDHILNGEFTSEQYKKEVTISDFDYVDSSNIKTVGSGALNATTNWKVNEFTGKNGINQYALVITGSGATPDYYSNSYLPWSSWKNKITSIVVESSISAIGNYIFANMTNLESAQIASSVISLGDYAFYNCPNLSNIQVTESTQFFGKCCIGGKYGETTWEYIPTQNKLIISGNGKMGEPYKSQDTLEMASEKVPWNRLASTITDVEIKNGVQNISSFAFSGFSSLSTVSMPKSISAIETSAFEHCKSLTYICLPQSVSEIGHYAFRYCEGLRNIHIPSSVKKIGVNVFYNCPYLHEFYFYGDAPSFENNALYNNEVITVFYNKSTSGWSSVKTKFNKVKFEPWTPDEYDDSGKNTGEYGIKYATSGKYGENVYWNFDENTGVLSITGSGSLQEPITISSTDADGTINIFYHTGAVPWNPFLLKIKSVNIDDGITDLTRYAFFCLQNVKSISIPDSVTNIGHAVFEKCYSLVNLNLGEKTTKIENEAFLDCNGLQSIYIPSTLKSFGDDAFKNTPSLKDIYYEGTQYQWNSVAKGNNSNYLKNVTIHYNCNKPTPDTSTFEFSLSGKKYFILNKEGTLTVSYRSAVDGQVLNELKNIKWTNSNPSVATVSGLDTGIADTERNNISVMATVKALNVGSTTIEGTSPDGRKASFTINVKKSEDIDDEPDDIIDDTVIYEQYQAKYYSENAALITNTYMTYSEIEDNYSPTDYVKNNILSFGWNKNFGFSDDAQIWETVILDILFKNGSSTSSIENWEKDSLSLSKELCTYIEKNNIADIDNSLTFDVEENLIKIMKSAEKSEGLSDSEETTDVIKKLFSSVSTIKEFVDVYSKYINLRKIVDVELKAFLYQMKNTDVYNDIPAFSRGLDKVLANISAKNANLAQILIQEKVSNKIVIRAINEVVGFAVKVVLGESVYKLIDITKTTTIHLMNTICGTDEIAQLNVYLYMVDKIDEAASEAFNNISQSCLSSNGTNQYHAVNGGFQFMCCLYTYGISVCRNWANVITTDILTRIESGPYNTVKRTHYDVATAYLNLNHSSSNNEKKRFIEDKCKEDEEYVDVVLKSQPAFARLKWYNDSGVEQDECDCIVVFKVQNPNGGYTLHAQVVPKNTKVQFPTLDLKSGYITPTKWYSSEQYDEIVNGDIRITENTVFYTRYLKNILFEQTDRGAKIISVNGIGAESLNYRSNLNDKSKLNQVGASYQTNNSYEIPAYIDGYKVVEIGDDIFASYSPITSVTIPKSVDKISNIAFRSCSNLIICGYEGSYAQKYAEENNIIFIKLTENFVADVNFDGKITVDDATDIQKYIAGMIEFSSTQDNIADVDGDGKVAISDVTEIQKYLAGLINHFGQPTSITLDKSMITMNVGDTKSLSATITPDDAPKKDVTWTSSDTNIVTVSNGVVTAKSPGTATVIAKTFNGKTASCSITVQSDIVYPTSITLKADASTLEVGYTTRLLPVVYPSNATDSSVTIENSDQNVVIVTTDGEGHYWMTGKAPGKATITAKTSNGKTATFIVNVVNPKPTSIAPEHWSYQLSVGETTKVLPIIKPDNAQTTVSWRSSDNSIATVDSSGTVTAVSEGNATITLTTDNGLSENCSINVTKISIGSFYDYIDHDLNILNLMYKQPQGLIVGKDDSVFINNYKDRYTKENDPAKFSEFNQTLVIAKNTFLVRANQNDYIGFYRTMFENRSLDAKVYNSVVQHQVDAFYDSCEASYYYTYFSSGDIEFSDFENRYKQCVERERSDQKLALYGMLYDLYDSTLDLNDKEIYHNTDNGIYKRLMSKIENVKTMADAEDLVQYFEKYFTK